MSAGSPVARAIAALPLLLGLSSWPRPAAAELPDERELRAWIEEFEASPRGPFERIRWFCADGSVHPAKPYPCANRGGGIQHGEWNQRARALRAGGYTVANVLADLEPQAFVGQGADLFALQQILIERYLIAADDGWIFRGARTYRGALQVEDEEAGAKAVVRAMLGDRAWREPERFLLLREAVRLLPLQADTGAAADVRKQALVLSGKDAGFTPLRVKIHNQPDPGDAAQVRAHAKTRGKAGLQGAYERLAAAIDALYAGGRSAERALALAPKVAGNAELSSSLDELGAKLAGERDPATRVAIAGRLMGLLRKHLATLQDPDLASEALQLSLVLESDGFASGRGALAGAPSLPASRRLELLDQASEALYGAGLLTLDQLADVKRGRVREDRRVLSQPPEWAERSLGSSFGRAIEHLATLEPNARLYVRDRMQVSLVPFYRAVLDGSALRP
jgi:hypothetical protein